MTVSEPLARPRRAQPSHRRPQSRPAQHPPAQPLPPAPGTRSGERPAPHLDGPHIRLGLAWAAGTLVVALLGVVWMAVWMGAAAALAALQVARSARGGPGRPSPALATVGAGLVPLAAVAGWAGCAPGLALGAGLGLLWGRVHAGRAGGRRTAALVAAFGLAAASPVLVLRHGLAVVLVLLALVAAYDASVHIVGTGANAAWEGPAAGVAAVLSLTLGVAAILVPPFRGASPWILGGLTAALAPAGVVAVSRLVVDPHAPVQGARRLDSLLLVGPLWAVLAAPLLGR